MELNSITEQQFNNKNLKEMVAPDNDLKNFLVEYTGDHMQLKEGSEITTEMVVEVVAKEFPEFLLAVAEENWVRGYQQALNDVDFGSQIVEKSGK
tara:strand:+ start:1513 stop:1797 length:285 start_codon:yes stop_codon:yes gene_type:complete